MLSRGADANSVSLLASYVFTPFLHVTVRPDGNSHTRRWRADNAPPADLSPALRDTNPSVVVIPGLGVFGFGKDKREARITTEFFINAIHVMAGATALEEGRERLERRELPPVCPSGPSGRESS